MEYNVENKVSFEELSPSLQNLLKSAATRSDIITLNNRTDKIVELLSGVKFNIVDKLEDIILTLNETKRICQATCVHTNY